MALVDTTWYVNFGNGTSTGYYAVTVRPQNAAVAAGVLRRQFTAPSVGNERVFVCIVAGTTANTTDATWSISRGAATNDGTARWQECTGMAAVNGDLTNTLTWTALKAAGTPSLGVIIKRNNSASYQICFTAGTLGASEPAFSDTAGVITNETSATAQWVSIGPVGNFTGGQAPHARLANALASGWFVSGNTVYVGSNHAETAGIYTLNASSALMARILCHNYAGSYPPASGDLTTGAQIATGQMTLNFAGSFYFRGMTFSSSAGTTDSITIGPTSITQVHNWYYFDTCSLQIATGSSLSTIQLGAANASTWAVVIFDNTTVKFGGTAQWLQPGPVQFVWRNTGQVLAAGSSVPAALFKPRGSTSGYLPTLSLEGLDLSQLTGSLFDTTGMAPMIGSLLVKDCKLNATTSVTTPINTGMTVQLAASASDATSYKSSRHTYEAVETTETSIVRTGGYVDPASQAQSRKIVTTANTQWLRPYQAQPLAVWNADVGSSKTVTVYGTVNSGSLPLNDEIWLDVSYLGSSSYPVGSVATSTKAKVLDAGVSVASDSSVWAVPSSVTWEFSTTTAVTLSGGDLAATNTGTTATEQGAHVTPVLAKTSGKYYFEMTFTNAPATQGVNRGFGVGTPESTYTGLGNNGTVGAMVFATPFNIWRNGVNTGYSLGVGTTTGTVIGIAVDLTGRFIWFRKVSPLGNWNGQGLADPATGTLGVDLPTGAMVPFCTFGGTSGVAGSIITANFGASAFTGTVPSGFTSGWPATAPSSFKLVATLTPQLPGYLIPQVKVAKASTTVYVDPLAVVT